MCVHIYIHLCIYISIFKYIYIYTQSKSQGTQARTTEGREIRRERWREGARERVREGLREGESEGGIEGGSEGENHDFRIVRCQVNSTEIITLFHFENGIGIIRYGKTLPAPRNVFKLHSTVVSNMYANEIPGQHPSSEFLRFF